MDAQADAPAKTSAYLPIEGMPPERDVRATTPDKALGQGAASETLIRHHK
jgi:hypothetical protein